MYARTASQVVGVSPEQPRRDDMQPIADTSATDRRGGLKLDVETVAWAAAPRASSPPLGRAPVEVEDRPSRGGRHSGAQQPH